MEVIEIISNFINKDNNVIEVEFRLNSDGDDLFRSDTIEFQYLKGFGYGENLLSFDIFNDVDDDWGLGFEDEDEDDVYIDEENLISFLNEYYLVYEDKLPDADYR